MVSLSMTKAEYIALTEGAKELILLQMTLQKLGFDQDQPTPIQCDNLGAITLSHNATYHARTKHINVTYHFIHKKVASNEASLIYVRLKENPMDLMMKGLEWHQFKYLREKLGYTKVRGSVV